MTTVKLKIKINNSYESEPSSGSGSSASEANEYENSTCEKDIPNIRLMLNPSYYSILNNDAPKSAEKIMSPGSDIGSSPESDFQGFTDYQIEERTVTSSLKPMSFSKNAKSIDPPLPLEHTSDTYKKMVRLYDVIIEQNSCNAVDMQLSKRNYEETPDVEQKFSNNLSSELSFNGKIKSLTATPVDLAQLNQNVSKSSPKILKAALEMNEISNYKYANERSPDLFDYDDDDDHEVSANVTEGVDKSVNCPTESSFAEGNSDVNINEAAISLRNNIRIEKELLKRIKTRLSGIPPPPSLTIPQLDLFTVITKNKEEILNFNKEVETVGSIILCEEEGIFKPSHPLYEVMDMPFKDTLGVRGHGLCYNICKASESIELLSLAVIERFIGAETSTSYTANLSSSPSSAKKRNLRQKMITQSSGTNRLSHLAKRRAAFSSVNLATSLQKPQSSSLGGMQILLDKKKGKSRRKGTTPKRMTPSSKKKAGRKTPSSSARKRLFFRFDAAKPGPSRETSKRALFQSPAKQNKIPVSAPKPTLKPEIANRVEKSKRALFSPDKTSQSSQIQSSAAFDFGSLSQASQSSLFGSNLDFLTLKRKRVDDDISEYSQQSKKAYRSESQGVTPRSLKIKSQSFCIGAGSTNGISGSSSMLRSKNDNDTSMASSSTNSIGRPIVKAFSDTTFHSSNLLTENHRKKLLWAVSQALQAKQINVTHGNFKQFASVLARVVRRLFQEFFLKSNSSTSDTMLRLSKKYVCNVMAGKSADEIYLYAKSKIDEEKRLSSTRLSGYIAPNEFETRKVVLSQTSLCSFENSMDMFGFSQNSSICLTQPTHSQRNPENGSQDNANSKSAIKLSIQPNASLQNSSSKNNLGGIALRENVDCEQRRSAQKNFTGIDQRNVSPYASTAGRSANKSLSFKSSFYELNSSTAKAKRQISFDSL